MTPAVAVHVGASATRLAAPGPDGRPEVAATLPGGTSASAAMESLHGDAPVPLVVLVHPPGWAPQEIASAAAGLGEWAATVRPVPAPLAVLAGIGDTGTGSLSPGGEPAGVARLVVDAGASGTELTVVAAGRAMPARRVQVGGDRLDAALGAALGVAPVRARAVREALSLRAQVGLPDGGRCDADRCREVIRPVLAGLAAAVAETVARSGAAEVVLLGGLARTPLVAELLDGAVDVPVRVVEVPESAAVLGALAVPGTVGDPAPPVERDTTAVRGTDSSPGAPLDRDGRAPAARRGRFRLRGAPVVAALGIALVAAGTVAGRVPAAPEPAPGTALVQYGYATTLPAGWEHTGGLPERRRTLLTRSGSPDGAELIAVERTPLGYDSALEPERARAELGAEFGRRAGEQDLRDYREDTVAGRPVIRYRQAGPGASVDWFVLFAGTDELVVGCRHPDAPAVATACDVVVGSVRPAGGG